MIKDSLIFSCDWDNYQKNVLIDKEDRTVGAWAISPENMQKLKYAYAYLTNSDKTVVKKFYIEKFEPAKIEKGYKQDWKFCFIFSKSEDVFFEYNKDPVQAPRYESSEELDALPRLNDEDKKVRLKKSEETPKVSYYSSETQLDRINKGPRKRSGRQKSIKETTVDKLLKVKKEKFADLKYKVSPPSDVDELIKKVEQGENPEDVLKAYFDSKEIK